MRLNVKNIEKGVTFTVLLDGKDISNRCYAFDTEESGGWVDCYKRDSKGELVVLDTFEVSKERLYGDVFVKKHISKGTSGKNE